MAVEAGGHHVEIALHQELPAGVRGAHAARGEVVAVGEGGEDGGD